MLYVLGDVTVAGWGTEDEGLQVVSPVLRKVTVPLVSSMSCVEQYGQYFRYDELEESNVIRKAIFSNFHFLF